MNFKSILMLLLVILVIVFVLQNTQVVEVRFFFWTVSMSRALMLLGTLIIGMVTGWLTRSLIQKS